MKLQAILISNLDKKVDFVAEVKNLDSAERLKRAIQRALAFLALAIISIPIIALHFVLVPSFLGLSVYSFVTIMKQHNVLISGDLICPDCQSKIQPPKASFNWPLKMSCSHCQKQIRVQALS